METSLGGVVGDIIHDNLMGLIAFVGISDPKTLRLVAGILTALGALVTFAVAVGLRFTDYQWKLQPAEERPVRAARAAATQDQALPFWRRWRLALASFSLAGLWAGLTGRGNNAKAAAQNDQALLAPASGYRETDDYGDDDALDPTPETAYVATPWRDGPAYDEDDDASDGEDYDYAPMDVAPEAYEPAFDESDPHGADEEEHEDADYGYEEDDTDHPQPAPPPSPTASSPLVPGLNDTADDENWDDGEEWDEDGYDTTPGAGAETPLIQDGYDDHGSQDDLDTDEEESGRRRFSVTRLLPMSAIRSLTERPRNAVEPDETDTTAFEPEPEEEPIDLEPVEPEESWEANAPVVPFAAPVPTPVAAEAPREKRTRVKKRAKANLINTGVDVFDLDPAAYSLPPLDLLQEPQGGASADPEFDIYLEDNARLLETVLQDFGVRGEIINVHPGPVVTLYELEPAPGIKSSRVIGLADDIARSMSAVSARVAVIPGRNAIGIELPNKKREMVYLRDMLASESYEHSSSRVALALGKDIGGDPVVVDLANMPHLLIAGTTGSGKSVAINTMILSLLYRMPPSQCKLILIDPKMLELSVYEGIPHLLTPVVTDPKKAIVALKWVVREMEDRYKKMSKLGVRNIRGFNERIKEAAEKGETLTRSVQTGFDKETGEPIYEQEDLPLETMPVIVVVVDEMADLMMVAGKEIETAVQRLAQMARAAGIHLITATQRPSVDVITGTIKANFPTRISFQVTSKIDSRTILGEQGAEQLLGQGDMLYMAGGGRIRRVHGPFVSDAEVEDVVAYLKDQGQPAYVDAITEEPEESDTDSFFDMIAGAEEGGDDLFDKAVAIVARDRKASTSYIQRKLQIGYNRAARLIERMEEEGMISPANHVGKREILLPEHGEEAY